MEVFKLLSVFVFILTILQIGSFLRVVVLWKNKRHNILAEYGSTICDPVVTNSEGETLSCKGVDRALKTKIEEEVKRRAKNGLNTESSLNEFLGKEPCNDTWERSSMLMNGISPETKDKGSGIVHWLSLVNSDTKGYLSYNDGSINISESGFYYLAFQIVVANPENKTKSFESKSENTNIEHSIRQRSSKGEKTVLENVRHDGCLARTSTMHTGGMFRLQKGDSVHVHTSDMQSVANELGHHSFMMYKI